MMQNKITFADELAQAPAYLEHFVLPAVLEGIEEIMRAVNQGNAPDNPILELAEVNGAKIVSKNTIKRGQDVCH
jgi:hypothetical protein